MNSDSGQLAAEHFKEDGFTRTILFIMDSQPTFRKREKVPLKPGFLLVDWYALVATGEDLAGFNKRKIKVPEEEVITHN